jgi:hypothetical protein
MLKFTIKISYIHSYVFRSIWTILRELTLRAQRATESHVARHSVHKPKTWNTYCHNTAKLITMYFYWLVLQKRNFSKAQRKSPEDGPKHVEANIR